jgi:hypothetical protein
VLRRCYANLHHSRSGLKCNEQSFRGVTGKSISKGVAVKREFVGLAQVFERLFTPLYGQPCWGIGPGIRPTLRLEFGKPHLEIHEPATASKSASARVKTYLARRRIFVHGQWHLWLYYCNWELLYKGQKVGYRSRDATIQRAGNSLNGEKLVRFAIAPKSMRCRFDFDLGSSLRTWPSESMSDQWLLYTPSRKVLVVRADGKYQYGRSDIDRGAKWKPIFE